MIARYIVKRAKNNKWNSSAFSSLNLKDFTVFEVLLSQGSEFNFFDGLASERPLGSWPLEIRHGNIESLASVMVMDIVEGTYTLCYITVLMVIYRIEEETAQIELL